MTKATTMRANHVLGFTLVELIISVTIVALLAAILTPVFVRARVAAHKAVSTSNLRQIGMAATLYTDEYETDGVPPPSWAIDDCLGAHKAPTCDPNDFWRSNCREEFGAPLVGSYGYARKLDNDKRYGTEYWQLVRARGANVTTFASVFYGSTRPKPFRGEGPASCDGGSMEPCYMPDKILRLRVDGSVALTSMPVWRNANRMLLTWDGVFTIDGPREWIVIYPQ